MKYIKLFSPVATFREMIKKLRSEARYILKGTISTIPAKNNNKEVIGNVAVRSENVTISVVIPVKNAGDDFPLLLSLLKNQIGFHDIEIIIVDSGSTDRSLEISEAFGAKTIKILPEEFSHAYARNLGAKHASGDYLLFTVQDALPPSYLWLHELFNVIKDNDVVAVSCTEFPKEDADLFHRALLWNHYRFLEIDKQDRIMCKPQHENHLTLRKNGQLSSIACLIRSNIFRQYEFEGLYAEDLDLGIKLIRGGYKLALLSSTRIIHSHNRPAYYHLKRAYVDTLVMNRILPENLPTVIEEDWFIDDLIFTYEVVKSIVAQELQRLSLPGRIEELSMIVMERLRIASKGLYPDAIDIASNGYIDNNFRAFLEKVYHRYYLRGRNKPSYHGVLLNAMQSFMGIIFEYINDSFELIDEHVLEEFKSCLYKAYAFQCGVHLGFCFLQRSERANEKIMKINEELIKEI